MSRSRHHFQALHLQLDVLETSDVRPTLASVIRTFRPRLRAEAKRQLGAQRIEHADDIVQEVCLAVLERRYTLAPDLQDAFRQMLGEILRRCRVERRLRALHDHRHDSFETEHLHHETRHDHDQT
jgi:DNA-directed RNA polymerase specialized sigma24 family protein